MSIVRRIRLFVCIVWRPCLSGVGRMGVAISWQVAGIIHAKVAK